MEEELSLDNILDGNDLDLFDTSEEGKPNEAPENEDKSNNQEEKQEEKTTTEVDVDNLFNQNPPEGRGSEEEDTKEEDTFSTEEDGKSPNNNDFYTSIAKALVEDGVYSLDADKIKDIKTAEDFLKMAKDQVESQLTEVQKRVNDALESGVEASEIQKYETGISQLESISEESLNAENEQGEKLRKWIIYRDYISRGFDEKRAMKELNKSISAGSDKEDAKDALESVLEHYKGEYNKLIEEAKEAKAEEEAQTKKEAESLKKAIMEEEKVFGDIEVSKSIRQKAFDVISKPVYRDPDTGDVYNELQKYEKDHKEEFLKMSALFYALTDGYKNVDKLVSSKVNKEMKKGIRELEHTLNNTARGTSGNIKFVSGVSDDPESLFGGSMHLDL